MTKNLGVVKWFGGGNKNYGFITFLSGNEDIFFHREGTKPATVIHNGVKLTVYPHEGELVSFDIVDTAKGLKAVNVTVLNAQALANETDFADEAGCRNFLEKLLSAKIGEKFLSEFIAAVPEENFRKYSWLREELSRQKHLELCLEMYAETPTSELEIEMTEILSGISTEMKFQIPPELVVKKIFREHSDMESKCAALERYFDTLTPEEISDWTKDFPPEKIIDALKDKANFIEKLPVIIEKSRNKFSWACYLVDNVNLFRQTKLGEDVLIFFMYKSVNRCNGQLPDLSTLIKLLNEKIDDIEAAPRAKIVYSYICAAFAKRYAKRQADMGDIGKCNEYLRKRDKFINDADETFIKIFNLLAEQIKTNAKNPDEKNADEIFKKFFEHEAQLLPPCSKSDDDENCVFCEAITWNKKIVGDDGKESFKLQSWCPRGGYAENCSRLFPKLNLPVKDWSIVELMAKLHLMPYEDRPEDHKYNLEFFTRLGGEFNRFKGLLERLKCRKCGKYMRAVNKYAKWKEITNIRRTARGDHFAIFAATTFSCQNDTCSEKDKPVYLSYCWHCGEIIDSRDNHVRIRGFYLCNRCGAGYREYVGNNHYTIFPGEICPSCTKCPKCGCQDFDITETFQLKCKKCGHVMNAPLKIKYTSKHDTHRKGECSCGHKLEWEIKPFWSNWEPIPWQKNFSR